MTSKRQFGNVPNIPVGRIFNSRAELSEVGLHRPRMAGISGTAADGVDSIVISGGYEDDRDEGAVVIYTGHGGNDPATGKQIADQELHRGNAGLAKNCDESLPVRVIRGAKLRSPYSPKYGYRYDGLYYVEKYWQEKGRSGYQVWRFRLVREDKYTGRSRK